MTAIEPYPDLPLLRKAVDWAAVEAAKPDRESQWDQTSWIVPAEERAEMNGWPSCDTAYCIAGYVAHLMLDDKVLLEDSFSETISECAKTALGVTDAEACALFHSANNIETVREVAECIAARVGERL